MPEIERGGKCETACVGEGTGVSAKQLFVDSRGAHIAMQTAHSIPLQNTLEMGSRFCPRRRAYSVYASRCSTEPCRNQPFVLQVILPLVGS